MSNKDNKNSPKILRLVFEDGLRVDFAEYTDLVVDGVGRLRNTYEGRNHAVNGWTLFDKKVYSIPN